MILLDKLSQRPINKLGGKQLINAGVTQPESPLPSITETINKPPTKPLTTAPLEQRLETMPQRGPVGSMPQWSHIPKRFIADLPDNMLSQGVQMILSGQDTKSPIINNFVRGLAQQGKRPEEIIAAFKEHQKNSPDPLVLME